MYIKPKYFSVVILFSWMLIDSALAQPKPETIHRMVKEIGSDIKQNPVAVKKALQEILKDNANLPDSTLGNIFTNLGLAYGVSNQLDSAKWAIDRAIAYFDKKDKRKASALRLKAIFFRLGGEYKQAEAAIKECLKMNEKTWEDKSLQCEILTEYSSLCLDQNDYFRATQYCLEAIKIIESANKNEKDFTQNKLSLQVKLAEVSMRAGNDSLAIRYLWEVLPKRAALKNYHSYLQDGYQLSNALIRTKQFNIADSLINQLLPVAKKLNNENYESYLLANLGISQLKRAQYPNALIHLRKSYTMMTKLQSPFILVCVVPYLEALKETRGMQEAIEIMNNPWLRDVVKTAGREAKMNYQKNEIHFLWNEMNPAQLNEYYQKLLKLTDTVNQEGDRKLALELQSKYQFDQQEKNKAALQRENDLLKKQTIYKRNQNYLILGISILILIAILQLTLRLRQRARLQSKRILLQDKEIEGQKQQTAWAEREKAYRDQLIEQQKILLTKSITDSEELKAKLNQLVEEQKLEKRKEMLEQLEKSKEDDQGLEKILMQFNIVHPTYTSNLHKAYPKLSQSDLQFCILYRMNLSTKEISVLSNVEPGSVYKKKYRLMDKMGLGEEDDFDQIIMSFE
jgi:hypothetical protein